MKTLRLLIHPSILHKCIHINRYRSTFSVVRYYHDKQRSSESDTNTTRGKSLFTVAGSLGLLSVLAYYKVTNAFQEEKVDSSNFSNRVISRNEVSKHNSTSKGVWITYKGKVYDVTSFIEHHPGGASAIMMGAGGDVEPFWQTYTVHIAPEVQNLLAKFQIGILPEDEATLPVSDQELEGPYANDPKRNPLLQILSQGPFNAETPANLLVQTQITPSEIFFVRNHLPVPEVDLESYRLVICYGTDGDPDSQRVLAEFTLDDLKTNFTPHTIDCVIQCSGNRRSGLKKIREIKGLNWNVGAIGNAQWTGVKLTDLLESLNVKPSDSVKHIQLEGLDADMSGQCYGASISADVAFNPNSDVLLAYEMNGQPLSKDHGFPVRFVAPGITGARNVKWLSKLILSNEESHSHWQRKDYKSFSPNVDVFNVNFDSSVSIQEMPVQSAICDPPDGGKLTVIRDGEKISIPVKGYAYSGGGKRVVRVDVSVDGGETWSTAELLDLPYNQDGTPDYSNRNRIWAWTRWSAFVHIPAPFVEKKPESIEIVCRAFDSSYNSQPERPETIWNVRGVVNNSWHRVKVNLEW